MIELGSDFTCRTGVTVQGLRGLHTCCLGFKLRFPWGTGYAKKSVGGTQSLSLVGGDFKAKQKYSLGKKNILGQDSWE